jgi:hypothetical protein
MTPQTTVGSKSRFDNTLRKLGIEQPLTPALKEQYRRVWPLLTVSLVLPILLLVVLAAAGLAGGIRISNLTRDPATITGDPFYLGLVSSLGLMLWAGSAAICWFSRLLLKANPKTEHVRFFFHCSALLTVVLLFDDAFLFHELVFPRYLLIPEKVVMAVYLLLFASYLFYFRRLILTTDYLLLLAALTGFGLSLVLDRILPLGDWSTFMEDNFKFIGISFWLVYFTTTARALLRLYPS